MASAGLTITERFWELRFHNVMPGIANSHSKGNFGMETFMGQMALPALLSLSMMFSRNV